MAEGSIWVTLVLMSGLFARHPYALARAYNGWIADFCGAASSRLFAAAMPPLQIWNSPWKSCDGSRKTRASAAPSSGPCLWKDAISRTRITNRSGLELANLDMVAAVHATPGLNNPEWTSHGPFIEKMKNRLTQTTLRGNAGGGAFAGGGSGAFTVTTTPLGHSLAPILAYWLDNYLFVASTLLGYGVMNRYPTMKVVVAHGKATWMEGVLEKFEASTRVIALQHYYPVRTDAVDMWEQGHVMLGFDADERGIRKLPERYSAKVVWGSRYPHDDTTSAWEAIELLHQANVDESCIERMMGGNAARQFGIELVQTVVSSG